MIDMLKEWRWDVNLHKAVTLSLCLGKIEQQLLIHSP